MSTNPNRPDYVAPDVVAAAPDVLLLRDLMGGTRAMQDSTQVARYIPQWPDETDYTWSKRTRAATLFEGLGRTVSAATGMLFQVPPMLTYPTDEVTFSAHWLDVDGMGTKGDVFAKRCAESAITYGHGIILVDFPSAPEGVVTAATERELNLRPRWAWYPRASILSWRTATIRNRVTITQVVLYEPAATEDGQYGVKTVQRYRVLSVREGVAGYEVIEKQPGTDGTFVVVDAGVFRDRRGGTRDTLPISVAYAGRTHGPLHSIPPLLGVAYANLSHWQNKTELQWGTRISAIEQPVITGDLALDPTTLAPITGVKIGWEHYVHLQTGGTFEWRGPSRSGMAELKLRCEEAEQEMAALGMSFLSRETRAAETAEAKRLDATAENSTLATAAQGIEDALNLAWSHHAWYEGVEDVNAPSLTLNRDFDRVTLDAAYIGAIGALVGQGLPVREAVRILSKGGAIPTTAEDELDQLALEWQAGAQAASDVAAFGEPAR